MIRKLAKEAGVIALLLILLCLIALAGVWISFSLQSRPNLAELSDPSTWFLRRTPGF